MEAATGKTILIVEDERDVVDLLTLNLRKTGGFNPPQTIRLSCRPRR